MSTTRKQIKKSRILRDWNSFKDGKAKLRTWKFNPGTKKRTMSYEGIRDLKRRKSKELKNIRAKELGLSQDELAKVLHVSKRTLQGWEIGRSVAPEPVIILCELLRDVPSVRKKLLEKGRVAA